METKCTFMFLVILLVCSCRSWPLESINSDHDTSTSDTFPDTDEGSTDNSNDSGFNMNNDEDLTDDWSDLNDGEDSLLGPDFRESSTNPGVMEIPDDDDDDEYDDTESEERVDGLVNKILMNFLKKANRTESDSFELIRRLLAIYIDNASEEMKYDKIYAKILEFIKNPDARELQLLALFSDSDYNSNYDSDDDSDYDSDYDSEDLSDDTARATTTTPPSEPEIEDTDQDVSTFSSNETIDIPEDIAVSLTFLTDPSIPKALEATKKLKAMHSEQRERTVVEVAGGFKFLNMASQMQYTKGLKKKFLVRTVKKELNEFLVGGNENLTDIVQTLEDYVEDDTRNEFMFSVISEVVVGHVKAIFVQYKQRDDGRYDLKKLKYSGKANLAATVVITRVTTGNSTNTQSDDVISYIPGKDVTKEDITGLFDVMLPDLGKVLSSFSSDEKPKGNLKN